MTENFPGRETRVLTRDLESVSLMEAVLRLVRFAFLEGRLRVEISSKGSGPYFSGALVWVLVFWVLLASAARESEGFVRNRKRTPNTPTTPVKKIHFLGYSTL